MAADDHDGVADGRQRAQQFGLNRLLVVDSFDMVRNPNDAIGLGDRGDTARAAR